MNQYFMIPSISLLNNCDQDTHFHNSVHSDEQTVTETLFPKCPVFISCFIYIRLSNWVQPGFFLQRCYWPL